jgi:subtilisin family serine protease
LSDVTDYAESNASFIPTTIQRDGCLNSFYPFYPGKVYAERSIGIRFKSPPPFRSKPFNQTQPALLRLLKVPPGDLVILIHMEIYMPITLISMLQYIFQLPIILILYRAKWADDYMRALVDCISSRIFKDGDRTMRKVKVAILDTGVDHKHNAIKALKERKCLVEFKGFVGSNEENDDKEKSTQDKNGHGTHITVLLAKVAPRAEFYIAKIVESTVVPLEIELQM